MNFNRLLFVLFFSIFRVFTADFNYEFYIEYEKLFRSAKNLPKLSDEQIRLQIDFFRAITDQDIKTLNKLMPEIVKSKLINSELIYRIAQGYAPLAHAIDCINPNINIIKLLLENNANPNEAVNGNLNFDIALMVENKELRNKVLNLLLDAKNFKVNTKNVRRETPLMIILKGLDNELDTEEVIEIIQKLINLGADLNGIQIPSKLRDNAKVCKIFQERESQNKSKIKKFFKACSDDDLKVISEFLKESDNDIVNVKGENGLTPLIIAVQNEKPETVKYLLANKADVNLQDDYGRSPLIWAATIGNKEIVQELLKSGAIKDLKDKDGANALKAAERYGNKEAANLLK